MIVLALSFAATGNRASADWWGRDEGRPIFDRGTVPTDIPPQQDPTATPVMPTATPPVPTATPRIGSPTDPPVATATPTTSEGNSSSSDDPCAAGKSYTGDYCGWSPRVGGDSGGGGSNQPRIGGPEVMGLSYTSGKDVASSDIIFLVGVLCLALYVKSKMTARSLN